jgi:hypothetical protein
MNDTCAPAAGSCCSKQHRVLALTGHGDLGHIVAFNNRYTVFRVGTAQARCMNLPGTDVLAFITCGRRGPWNERGSACIQWVSDVAG